MIVIDIEASSLNDDSYPIEIAWADIDNPNHYDSFLIVPDKSWNDWSEESQQIHGITREELFENGTSIQDAAQRLDNSLSSQMVYSNRHGSDIGWLLKLYHTCGIDALPFKVQAITTLLPPSKVESFWRRLGQSGHFKHRALDDVQKLIKHINYFRH